MKKQKAYIFPAGKITIRPDGKCFETPNWCPMISVERPRRFVAEALLMLRQKRTLGRKTA